MTNNKGKSVTLIEDREISFCFSRVSSTHVGGHIKYKNAVS